MINILVLLSQRLKRQGPEGRCFPECSRTLGSCSSFLFHQPQTLRLRFQCAMGLRTHPQPSLLAVSTEMSPPPPLIPSSPVFTQGNHRHLLLKAGLIPMGMSSPAPFDKQPPMWQHRGVCLLLVAGQSHDWPCPTWNLTSWWRCHGTCLLLLCLPGPGSVTTVFWTNQNPRT